MPPEIDDPQTDPLLDPAPAGAGPMSATAVRESPEYKELARQNRELARQAGQANRDSIAARAEAERARAAAEAESQADLERELAATLGEDGVAAYNEIAELSQTDPRAAARRMAALMSRAQTPEPEAPPDPGPPEAPGGNVPPQVPPLRGVDAGAPLSPPPATDPYVQLATDLEKTYSDAVARNQNPATRNRMTMKDRAAGMIAYLGAAYTRNGARPKG